MTANGQHALPLPAGSVSHRINLEPILFAGGGRAVLMQVAHPSVAAGVAAFSDYRTDPWNRLFRTTDVMFKLAFGSPEESDRQRRILDARHRRVKGTDDTGRAYSAGDADLLLWVWATLVDTSMLTYQRVFGPLATAERSHFYREQMAVAIGCGTPAEVIPETLSDFESYMARVVADDLVVTDSARDVMAATMVPPLPPPIRQIVGPANRAVTAALLPPTLRRAYGFRWDGATRAQAAAFFAMASAGRFVPGRVRRWPSVYQLGRARPLRVRPPRRSAEATG